MQKIAIGISACLLGEQVRYDGGHKRDAYINGTLSQYFEFRPCCPEVEIGLGIPRPSIQLVENAAGIECLGTKDPSLNVTKRLQDLAQQHSAWHTDLCGYLLKKDSPSCGMERVKVYRNGLPQRIGTGIYAQQLMANNPLLPIEEEGRLGDPGLRENFIQRVYVLFRWKQLIAEGLTPQKLMVFHARHKLIIMSHADYSDLGHLLAKVNKNNLTEIATQYSLQLMQTLKKVASRGNHVNVLQHIQGYLKQQLDREDKAELVEVIERYRIGEIPLIVPLTLLKHHFRKAPDAYINDSYYLNPYPQQLQLINQL